jgi:hypothetical protein
MGQAVKAWHPSAAETPPGRRAGANEGGWLVLTIKVVRRTQGAAGHLSGPSIEAIRRYHPAVGRHYFPPKRKENCGSD